MEGSTKQQVRGDQGMIGIPALIDCPMLVTVHYSSHYYRYPHCVCGQTQESLPKSTYNMASTTKLQAHQTGSD